MGLEGLFSGGGDREKMKRLGMVLAAVGVILAGLMMMHSFMGAEDDSTVVKIPDEYHFRCTECKHEWTADKKTVPSHFGGGLPTTLSLVECTSCRQRAAYMLANCPWCKKGYIHSHLLRGAQEPPRKDPCPHCGKDTLTWRAGGS